MIPLCRTAALTLLAGLLGAATAVPVLAADRSSQDSNALIMTAEIALRRDDCGRAAADYAAAAQRLTDVRVSQRAAQVALECGQYGTAEQVAARWRQLQPGQPGPLRAAMRAALGLYHIDVARGAFERWLASYTAHQGTNAVGSSRGGARAPASGPAGAAGSSGGGATTIGDQLQQLADENGVPATLAMLQGVQAPRLQTGDAQLALANLAFDGWNYQAALQYGERALSDGAARAATQLVLARAHAGLGEAQAAEAAASAARAAAPEQQTFANADVLLLLGRDREARAQIEAVLGRNPQNVALRSQAQRRLGLLAFDSGDYDEAKRQFSALLKDRDSAAVAVYYLSAIAERRGEVETALRGYQLLGGTALEPSARIRAATLLLKHGQANQALQLLAPASDASPAARVDAEIEQAQLLADGGQPEQALARINEALERSPGHPDLLYQRAIVLEKAGRTNEAIAQLDALYRQRPQDGEIANALGFILTDHDRDLARAQRLISLALKGEPDNPAILDSMGWLQYRRGMPQAALPLLERAFRLDQDGDIGAHWGEVLWSLGEKAKAREAWSRALIADPDNAAVKAAEKRLGAPQLLTPGAGTSV